MTTKPKPLELNLSDEEKKDIAIRVINERWDLLDKRLSDFTPSISALGDAIASAATRKATWGCAQWLMDWQYGKAADALIEYLESKDIKGPVI